GGFRRTYEASGIEREHSVTHQETKERAHRGQLPADRYSAEVSRVEVRKPFADLEDGEGRDGGRFCFGRGEVLQKLPQVRAVGVQRVGGGAGTAQVVQKAADLDFEFRHARGGARPEPGWRGGRLRRGGHACLAGNADVYRRRAGAGGRRGC